MADFSEGTTCEKQDDLPHDGKVKMFGDYNPHTENDILDVLAQRKPAVEGPQRQVSLSEACSDEDIAVTLDKTADRSTGRKYDMDGLCIPDLHVSANKGDTSVASVSDILLHYLSKELAFKGPGSTCETPPKICNADSLGEKTESIVLHCAEYSWLKEETPELADKLSSKKGDQNHDKLAWSSAITEENTSDFEKQVAMGDSSHQENSESLVKFQTLSDRQQSRQGQAPQRQQTQEASSDSGLKGDQSQVQHQVLEFLKVVPNVDIHGNKPVDRSLTPGQQLSILPRGGDKSVGVPEVVESMSRSNDTEKQEQERPIVTFSQQTQMETSFHTHHEHLTGIESETNLSKLLSTLQKDRASSPHIFQKISQGKQMCEKLKEQTDKLKTKVWEFSQSIAQDSAYHLQDRKQIPKKLQGHRELLEQKFLGRKEEHLTLQQQVYKCESPAGSVFDPERKAEGAILTLETLPGGMKVKTDEDKRLSAPPLAVSSAVLLDALALASSPPSNEVQEDPNSASPRQDRVEITRPSCVFCQHALEWRKKLEEKDHRKIKLGKLPLVIQDKPLRRDSVLRRGCYSCGIELKSNKTEILFLPGVCSKESFKEFHYSYNAPGESHLAHDERNTLGQLCFLNENKNSSSSCSEPNGCCSQRTNSKFSQDEPRPGKKTQTVLTTNSTNCAKPSPHCQGCKISGSKPLCNAGSAKGLESDILNASLDYAIRTAAILRITTEEMIKTIAEDLLKIKRWRSRLRY